MSILSKFRSENKINVGVSVSPTAGLEMVVVDPVAHKVNKYAQRPIGYNISNREIESYDEFKALLEELFKELKIEPKSANVVLNLPNVYFGHTFLPTTLDDGSVTMALQSEVEQQSYLFKKNEPAISWQEVKANNTTEQRYVLYAALQESVVDRVTAVFKEIGSTLVAIENTYSSLIKTLEFTGLTKDFAKSGGSWNILLISKNSYSVFSMLGYNVIEYYEDPLAIKSFNGDEVYVAISQAASSVMERFPADKLFIVSESSDVSAEILAIQMKYPGDVIFLECNRYSNQHFIDVDLNVLPNYVKNITPEAVGAAIYRATEFSIKMNFIQNAEIVDPTTVNFLGLTVTKEQSLLFAAFIFVVLCGIGYLGSTLVDNWQKELQSKYDQLDAEQQSIEQEMAAIRSKKNKVTIYFLVKRLDESMVTKILYYNALGANIPAKVWITSFYADTQGSYGIEGQTTSVDDIYLFYRNVKSQVANSDLIVSKLSVDDHNGMLDIEHTPNADYSFALSNSNYSQEKLENLFKEDNADNGKEGEVPNLPNLPN